MRSKEEKARRIRKAAPDLFRAMYYCIIGHLLLLMSAISEHGQTELSRVLIPKPYQTGEMIESAVAAMMILALGMTLFTYFTEKEEQI